MVFSFDGSENWFIYSFDVADVDENDSEVDVVDDCVDNVVVVGWLMSWFLLDANISLNWIKTSLNDGLSKGSACQHFSRRFISVDGVRVSCCPCEGRSPLVAARNAAL